MPTAAINFSVSTDPPPEGCSYDFTPAVYQHQSYLDCQPEPPACSFWLYNLHTNQIISVIHFYRQGDSAVSQLYAPFGSFGNNMLAEEVCNYFLNCVLQGLAELNFKEVIINHPAGCYQERYAWHSLLGRQGLKEQSVVNHHLTVDATTFGEKIHKMELRKLNKCHQSQMKFVNTSLKTAYDFISSCRKERGQSLSLSFARLVRVVKAIPEKFLIRSVESADQIAAAAIVIKVTPICWYLFYPAHSRAFDKVSPLVYLVSKLYEEAYQNGISILDLGTSQVNGTDLEGLIKFKTRIGGHITNKSTFTRSL